MADQHPIAATDNGPAGDIAALMDALGCDADRASAVLAALIQPRNGFRVLIMVDRYQQLEGIERAAEAYRDECECPAPDLPERRRLRAELFDALASKEV